MYWHWIRNARNYGDLLTPVVVKACIGVDPVYSASGVYCTGIGSILSRVSSGCHVWGTGGMHSGCGNWANGTNKPKEDIVIHALRGVLTERILVQQGVPHRWATSNRVFGDPALLLPRSLPFSPTKEYDIVFIPHAVEYSTAVKKFAENMPKSIKYRVVNLGVNKNIEAVVEQIISGAVVFSSALHGLITAEAYGIPAVWMLLTDAVHGAGFKFADYYSASGRFILPLDMRSGINAEKIISTVSGVKAPMLPDLNLLFNSCPSE